MAVSKAGIGGDAMTAAGLEIVLMVWAGLEAREVIPLAEDEPLPKKIYVPVGPDDLPVRELIFSLTEQDIDGRPVYLLTGVTLPGKRTTVRGVV